MKLCRYGPVGKELPGIIDSEGRIRALTGYDDITSEVLDPHSLEAIRRLDISSLPIVDGAVRYGVPIRGVRTFIGIGLNYADHAAESNLSIPDEPAIFNKWISCLSGANDPIIIPRNSVKTDWEVELGVVIGRQTSGIDESSSLDHVAGYCIVNDVSEREWQLERGLTWDKGKGFPTFGPVGPWLVTADEVGDPQTLSMRLEVNGKQMQSGSTSTMIFSVAKIVAYCSKFMTLEAGDIITTGTPPGVGLGHKPNPKYLVAGDVVTLEIEKLGRQRQECVGSSEN